MLTSYPDCKLIFYYYYYLFLVHIYYQWVFVFGLYAVHNDTLLPIQYLNLLYHGVHSSDYVSKPGHIYYQEKFVSRLYAIRVAMHASLRSAAVCSNGKSPNVLRKNIVTVTISISYTTWKPKNHFAKRKINAGGGKKKQLSVLSVIVYMYSATQNVYTSNIF